MAFGIGIRLERCQLDLRAESGELCTLLPHPSILACRGLKLQHPMLAPPIQETPGQLGTFCLKERHRSVTGLLITMIIEDGN